MTTTEGAVAWVDAHADLLARVHDAVWRYAEVGLQERRTAALLADLLAQHGFRVERGVAGMPTAFVATWGEGRPAVGALAELDALPGVSQKVLPRREPLTEGGAGHGCGHNIYAATALGGALAAKAVMQAHGIGGTVKCFGCPAEETLVGKVFMVREGLFRDLDACLGHHPGSANGVGMGSGNAMNSVKFEFFGVPSHAAGSPESGISALDAVELMNVGVNYMREHVVQEARLHYVIEEGGHEPNVVPPYARVWYYVRAPQRELVNRYYEWVLRIADGADLMARTHHRVRFLTGVHEVIPNLPLAQAVVANMRLVGAPSYSQEELAFARQVGESIPREQKLARLADSPLPNAEELIDVDLNPRIYDPFGEGRKGGGSTDVAEVSWNLPTVEFSTAAFVVGAPGHSWQHTALAGSSVGRKSTLFAAKVMAATMLDLLTRPELLEECWNDWRRRMKGRVYQSPLPPDQRPPLDQLPPQTP
ncbi:MAG: amidohydrolase [Armatimonadota bacterium]|nr:amidohydrolase [Armatimonadota bacterium]